MFQPSEGITQEEIDKRKAVMRATILAEEQMLVRRDLFKKANLILKDEKIAEEVVKPLWWANLDRTYKKNRKMFKALAKMPMPLNMSNKDENKDTEAGADSTGLPLTVESNDFNESDAGILS